MANVTVIGAQWGDEGKGKIVDWLASRADAVVRFQGGHNAGHTLVVPVEEKQRLAELSAESRAALMEGVADAQRRLGKVFDTQDFTVVLHDGPLAGQEVPHVHVHVMPRTKGDGGRCAGMAAFPDAPPIGSVEPDFAALGALSEKLQAA